MVKLATNMVTISASSWGYNTPSSFSLKETVEFGFLLWCLVGRQPSTPCVELVSVGFLTGGSGSSAGFPREGGPTTVVIMDGCAAALV